MYRNNYLYFLSYKDAEAPEVGHLLMAAQEELHDVSNPAAVELVKRVLTVCPVSGLIASYDLLVYKFVSADDAPCLAPMYEKRECISAEQFVVGFSEANKPKSDEVEEEVS